MDGGAYVARFLIVALCREAVGHHFRTVQSIRLEPIGTVPMVCSGICRILYPSRFLNRNLEWIETFSHELTHIIVAMLFFRKVHSFNAGLHGGVVETSGKNTRGIVPMSLAPYCLPIFSYLLLLFRPLIDFEGRWIFDVLIGMTLCFHFFCFRKQTGSFQTDINQFPLSFSYFYIAVAHLMNFCIIWVVFFPRYNVFTSTWRMITTIWSSIVGLL